jgi:hypothetical protein
LPQANKPIISILGNTQFCEGDSVRLTSSYASGNQWNNSATTQQIVVKQSGWYFVTINARNKRPLFGTLIHRNVVMSDLGRLAETCWLAIPEHFPSVVLDELVIMPDHMHGLLELRAVSAGSKAPSLGDVVGAYKSAVSRAWGRGSKGRQLPAHPLPARALDCSQEPDPVQGQPITGAQLECLKITIVTLRYQRDEARIEAVQKAAEAAACEATAAIACPSPRFPLVEVSFAAITGVVVGVLATVAIVLSAR